MQPNDAAASETSFAITYQDFVTSRVNQDFRGKGLFVVRGAGPTYVFSGKKREMTGFLNRPLEIECRADQIRNVAVEGRCVAFVRKVGDYDGEDRPFLFFCRNAEEAAAAAALLPTTKDEDFVATREFAARLKQMPGPATAWTSVTSLIIATNVIVFVVMGLIGAGWVEVNDIMPYVRHGANRADVTTDGEWWRLVASMFIHFGVVHLLLNMWALFQNGHLAEKLFGRVHFAIAYFGSGLAGSFATILWHREKLVWSAGASGAVFGIYGALLGYMWREKHGLPKGVFKTLAKSTFAFAGYNLIFGLAHPGIDNAAHLGGLASGVLLGWLLALPVEPEARARVARTRLALGLGVVVIISTMGVLFTPRFDYRLADELAWQKVNQGPVAQETEAMKRQQVVLTAYASGKDRGEASRWLAEQAIPLYTNWRNEGLALKLAPGRMTERRRHAFANILRLKVEAYESLLASSRSGGNGGMQQFQEAEANIAAELKKMTPPGK
jgi:membrane associated rhomboid family serine protease